MWGQVRPMDHGAKFFFNSDLCQVILLLPFTCAFLLRLGCLRYLFNWSDLLYLLRLLWQLLVKRGIVVGPWILLRTKSGGGFRRRSILELRMASTSRVWILLGRLRSARQFPAIGTSAKLLVLLRWVTLNSLFADALTINLGSWIQILEPLCQLLGINRLL